MQLLVMIEMLNIKSINNVHMHELFISGDPRAWRMPVQA